MVFAGSTICVIGILYKLCMLEIEPILADPSMCDLKVNDDEQPEKVDFRLIILTLKEKHQID